MPRRYFFSLVLFLLPFVSLAQWQDPFTDGDLVQNPSWHGDRSKFQVISQQLHLRDTAADSQNIAQLYTPSTVAQNATWTFWEHIAVNPSSSNFTDVYLMAQDSTLTQTKGYFVRLGDAQDEISLYRRDGNQVEKIIDGPDNALDQSDNTLRVQVRRMGKQWKLSYDLSGGQNFQAVDSAEDVTYPASHYFGVQVHYTSTRADKFSFDDFVAQGEAFTDTIPPELSGLHFPDFHTLQLAFSEPIDANKFQQLSTYSLDGNATPDSLWVNATKDSAWLYFTHSFKNGSAHQLHFSALQDTAGNAIQPGQKNFTFIIPSKAQRGDVVINELMPDPTPSQGLPEKEYVELYNRTDQYYQLKGWQLSDANHSAHFPEQLLAPHHYLLLCDEEDTASFKGLGDILGLSNFPSLNNSSDVLILENAKDTILETLAYRDDWYSDEAKGDGHSLELINPYYQCVQPDLWTSSTAPAGGSPGTKNAVFDSLYLGEAPHLTGVQFPAAQQVALYFSKPLETPNGLPNTIHFQDGRSIANIQWLPEHRGIELSTNGLENGHDYNLSFYGLQDCNGNPTAVSETTFRYDVRPPVVNRILGLSNHALLVICKEPIAAQNLRVYLEGKFTLAKSSVQAIELLLQTTTTLQEGLSYSLELQNLSDTVGNTQNLKFNYTYTPLVKPYFADLIISEIMAKPAEGAPLPNAEYLEIYNAQNDTLSLAGVQLADARDTTNLPPYFIAPHQYLVLSYQGNASAFSSTTLPLDPWPTLNNAGDALHLFREKTLIDQLYYTDDFYHDQSKADAGGWSMEMLDVQNPCGGLDNWHASVAKRQGTPGTGNSVAEPHPDHIGPKLLHAWALSADSLWLVFNEPLNPTSVKSKNFELSPDIPFKKVVLKDDLQRVLVKLAGPLQKDKTYKITANGLQDCAGNYLQEKELSFGEIQEAQKGDLLLSELLFDPKPNGVDFVELYNHSPHYLDLGKISWQGKEDRAINPILEGHKVMPPHTYMALTSDTLVLKNQYPTHKSQKIWQVTSLPSLPNTAGRIALFNGKGEKLEALAYTDKLHNAFLQDPEGVSLERISFSNPSQSADNWTSAAEQVGYATPGYQNSTQDTANQATPKVLTVRPKVFIPGSPGRGFTKIYYHLRQAGLTGSLKIMDYRGRIIKKIAENIPLSKSGFFRWDGDNKYHEKTPTGYYIAVFQVLDAQGDLQTFRKKVAVGSNF